jgi:hypothetical protein
MSTMAVLRAAQVDSKGKRLTAMVAALVAVLGVGVVLFVFVIRPKLVGEQPPTKLVTTSVAPIDTFGANVPAVSTVSTTSPTPAIEAGAAASAVASTSPARPSRPGDRPTAATSARHGTRPGTTTKPTADGPPTATTATTATPKPTGDFTDFGNRK